MYIQNWCVAQLSTEEHNMYYVSCAFLHVEAWKLAIINFIVHFIRTEWQAHAAYRYNNYSAESKYIVVLPWR